MTAVENYAGLKMNFLGKWPKRGHDTVHVILTRGLGHKDTLLYMSVALSFNYFDMLCLVALIHQRPCTQLVMILNG